MKALADDGYVRDRITDRMTEEADERAPDWRIWRNLIVAKLYECVALSLNIDPRKLRHNSLAWMTGGPGRPPVHVFDEGQAFKDRLFLADRSLGNALWPVNWKQYTRGADPVVKLAVFAGWARSCGWEMPVELFQLTGDAGQSAPSATTLRFEPGQETRGAGRREWIDKFRQRQHAARRWIEFVEIAKWCARSTTGTSADDEQRALELAYQRLANSVLQGEFEACGRSKILYLDPTVTGDGVTPRWRLSREQFEIAATFAAPSLPILVLARCWLRRERAAAWLELHGYRLPPYLAADTAEFGQSAAPADTAIEQATPSSAPGAMPRPTVRDDELRAWYAGQVEKNEPTSEAADWEAARRKFGQRVRREQVRDLRRKLAPEAWRKQGRRRKAAGNSAN